MIFFESSSKESLEALQEHFFFKLEIPSLKRKKEGRWRGRSDLLSVWELDTFHHFLIIVPY